MTITKHFARGAKLDRNMQNQGEVFPLENTDLCQDPMDRFKGRSRFKKLEKMGRTQLRIQKKAQQRKLARDKLLKIEQKLRDSIEDEYETAFAAEKAAWIAKEKTRLQREAEDNKQVSDLFGDFCDFGEESSLTIDEQAEMNYGFKFVSKLSRDDFAKKDLDISAEELVDRQIEGIKRIQAKVRKTRRDKKFLRRNKQKKTNYITINNERRNKYTRLAAEFVEGFKGQNETEAEKRKLDINKMKRHELHAFKMAKMQERILKRQANKNIPVEERKVTKKKGIHPNKLRKIRKKQGNTEELIDKIDAFWNIANDPNFDHLEEFYHIRSEGMDEKEYSVDWEEKTNTQFTETMASCKRRYSRFGFDYYVSLVNTLGKENALKQIQLTDMQYQRDLESCSDYSSVDSEPLFSNSVLDTVENNNVIESITDKQDKTFLKRIYDSFPDFVKYIADAMYDIFSAITDGCRALLQNFLSFFPLKKMWKLCKKIAHSQFFYDILNWFLTVFNLFVGLYTAGGNMIATTLAWSNFINAYLLHSYRSQLINEVRKSNWATPNSESLSDAFSKFSSFVDTLHNSEFINSTRNIILYGVMFKWFPKIDKNNVKFLFGKLPNMGILELFAHILKSVKILFRYGEKILQGATLNEILLSSDPVQKFLDDSAELLLFENRLYLGLPTPGYKNLFDYGTQCQDLIKTGEFLKTEIFKADSRYKSVKEQLLKLKNSLHVVSSRTSAKSRIPPIGIQLVGPSGIGKSKLLPLPMMVLHGVMRMQTPYSDDMIFTYCTGEEFMDGHLPLSQPAIFFSEVANESADRAMIKENVVLEVSNRMLDGRPMLLKYSDVADKGKHYCQAMLVLSDTNNEDMHAEETMYDPSAQWRRWLLVKPKVKKEYRKVVNGITTWGLNEEKSVADGGDLLDRWTFDVFKRVPTGYNRKKVIVVTLLKDGTIYQYLDFLFTYITKYYEVHCQIEKESMYDEVRRTISCLQGMYPAPPNAQVPINDTKQDDDFYQEYTLKSIIEDEKKQYDLTMCDVESNYSDVTSESLVQYIDRWNLYAINNLMTIGVFCVNSFDLSWSLLVALFSWAILPMLDISEAFLPAVFTIMYLVGFMFLLCYLRQWLCAIILTLAIVYVYRQSGLTHLYIDVCRNKWYYNTRLRRDIYWRRVKAILGMQVKVTSKMFKNALPDNKILCTLLSSFAAGLLAYKAYAKYFRKSIKSEALSPPVVDHIHMAHSFEQHMRIMEPRISISSSDGQPFWNVVNGVTPIMPHTGSPEELELVCTSNIYFVKVKNDLTFTYTHIFGIKGEYALINSHCIPSEGIVHMFINDGGVYDEKSKSREKLIPRNRIMNIGNDLTLLHLEGEHYRNILKHIIEVLPSDTYDEGIFKADRVFIKRCFAITTEVASIPDALTYNHEHRKGYCGRPIFARVNAGRSAILGIHAAGIENTFTCFAAILNKKRIEDGLTHLQENCPTMTVCSEGLIYQDRILPGRKSSLKYMQLPHLKLFGTINDTVRINKKSNLIRLDDYKEVENYLYEEFNWTPEYQLGKPMMKPERINGEYFNLYNNALFKMNNNLKFANDEVLGKTINVVTDRLYESINAKGIKHLSAVNVFDAVNGVKTNSFFRRINANTSATFGFKGKKSDHLRFIDEKEIDRFPTKELMEEVVAAIKCYLRDECFHGISVADPKDEPRKMSKCLTGDTRLYYIAPIVHLILSRMVLWDLFTLMSTYSDIFYTAIGINVYTGAAEFFESMVMFSPFIWEGDYKWYDVNNPLFIAKAAATVQYKLLERFGYSEYELKIVKGVLSDSLYPIIAICNDLMCKPGMQISGKGGTAEDNSKRNLIMLVYYWYMNPNTRHLYFFDYVKPGLYGDDVLVSVKAAVREFYNAQTYAIFCKEHYGMEFTDANKTGIIKPFVDQYEMTFLKRHFVMHHIGQIAMPIDMHSIAKMLEWYIPSKSESKAGQLISTARSSLWEIFFHCKDRAQFIRYHQWLGRRLSKLIGGMLEDYNLPQYEEILMRVSLMYVSPRRILPVSESLNSDSLASSEGSFSFLGPSLPEQKIRDISPDNVCLCRCTLTSGLSTQLHANYDSHRTRMIDFMEECKIEKMQLMEQLHEMKYEPYVGYGLNTYKRNKNVFRGNLKGTGYIKIVEILTRISDLDATISNIMSLLERTCRIISEAMNSEDTVDASVVSSEENILDIGGDVPFLTRAGRSIAPEIGQQETLSIARFAERPVEVDNVNIAVASELSAVYPLWDIISLESSIRAKLRNFAYLRCNIHVRICISGTPFHAGKILFSYQPYPVRNETLVKHLANIALDASLRPLLLNYLSQAPGSVVMDVRDNKPVEIIIPYISTKPMHRLFNNVSTAIGATTSFIDLEEAGSLFAYTINPIKAFAPTPPPVNMQVYAWFENVQLGTPTGTLLAINTEGKDERFTGPLESISTALAVYTRALTMVPTIAPLARASTMVLQGISGLASWFGWSRPTMIEDVTFVKNRPFCNSCVTVGSETTEKLTWDPLQELVVDPRVVGMDMDELSLAYLNNIESYLTTFVWDADHLPLVEPIWICKVTPTLCTYVLESKETDEYYQPTALCFAAMPFEYWHGSVQFRFEIVCSKFHRGRLAFFYEPNIDQHVLINGNIEMNKHFMKVIDIQETTSIELIVNWASPRGWNMIQPVTEIYDNFTATAAFTIVGTEGTCNGYIGVIPFTALQSPTADLEIDINVYVKGIDMQYQFLTGTNLPTMRHVVSESADMHDSKIDNTVSAYDLNNSTAMDKGISEYYFGEQPLSFRSGLKRYVHTYNDSHTSAAEFRGVKMTHWAIIPASPQYGSTTESQPMLIKYLPYAYLAVRGGVRKRVRYVISSASAYKDPMACAVATNTGPIDTFTAGINEIQALEYVSQRGTLMTVPYTNGGFEFEVPFYSNNLFAFSCANDLVGTNGSGDMEETWNKAYSCSYEIGGPISTEVLVQECTAAGEDFNFMRYLGAPYFTLVTP